MRNLSLFWRFRFELFSFPCLRCYDALACPKFICKPFRSVWATGSLKKVQKFVSLSKANHLFINQIDKVHKLRSKIQYQATHVEPNDCGCICWCFFMPINSPPSSSNYQDSPVFSVINVGLFARLLFRKIINQYSIHHLAWVITAPSSWPKTNK